MAIKSNDIDLLNQLLDSKLKNIEDKIDSNHILQSEISNNILQQTTRTNGRVTKLEDRVNKVVETENNHHISCPRIPEFKELDKKFDVLNNEVNTGLTEVRFIKNNPKISAVFFTILIVYIIGTLVYGGYEVLSFFKSILVSTVSTVIK